MGPKSTKYDHALQPKLSKALLGISTVDSKLIRTVFKALSKQSYELILSLLSKSITLTFWVTIFLNEFDLFLALL